MSLTKMQIDAGFCIDWCMHYLIGNDKGGVNLKNLNGVEVSVDRRSGDSFKVLLSYHNDSVPCVLNAFDDVLTPSAWENALNHHDYLKKFLDKVPFINHNCGPYHYKESYGRCYGSPCANTWTDMSNRLNLSLSAAKFVVSLFNSADTSKKSIFDKWVGPATLLRWDADQNLLRAIHYITYSHSPVVTQIKLNSTRDGWENELTDIFLTWLSTGQQAKFVSMFVSYIYWENEHTMDVPMREISNRFKGRLGIKVPLWAYADESIPMEDADVAAFRSNKGNICILPLTKVEEHAPIFTKNDGFEYLQDYICK